MRFDEIDLIGEFKIKGLTAESGKAIGFSGSNIEWIDAASGGTPANGLASTGYNYVIISATGSPIENGDTLSEIGINPNPYINGTLSDENRLQVLLMPGEYDMSNGHINLATDYIDFVGISSNPYDTVIYTTLGPGERTIAYAGVNFGLYNLYFKSGSIEQGLVSPYMRWKNIVFGDGVFNLASQITEMRGEFEDITLLGNCDFANCTNSIDAIFNNIRSYGTGTFFKSIDIAGYFTNIHINQSSDCFYSTSTLGGLYLGNGNTPSRFENITIEQCSNKSFCSDGTRAGTYRNIHIKVTNNAFNSPNDVADSLFENITIDQVGNNAFFHDATFGGKYKNIKIGDVGNDCFYASVFYESAIFDGINVGKVSGKFYSALFHLNGTFNNITSGDVTNQCFSGDHTISGTHSNISVGNVGGNFFYSDLSDFIADVKNVKAGNISGSYVFSTESGTLYKINAENINIGNCSSARIFSNRSGTELQGTFKNIEVGDASVVFQIPSGALTASNIQIGNVGKFLELNNNGIFVNLNSIKMGNVTAIVGDTGGSLYGNDSTINNLIIGNVSQDVFSNTIPPIVKNLTVGNIGGSCLYSNGSLGGLLENITVGNVGKDFITATGTNGSMGGEIRNIKAGNILGSAFSAYTDFATNMNSFFLLKVKDVDISSCKHIFRSNGDGIKTLNGSLIENVGVGTCSTAFQYTSIGSNSKVKNFSMTGVFEPDRIDGMVEKSYFNMSDRNVDFQIVGTGKIERNKILVGSARTVQFPNQIPLYNLINYGSLLNIIGSVSNIIDSDITP